MKLDKLRMLREELRKEFEPSAIGSTIYYFFDGRWNQLDVPSPMSQQITNCLNLAATESIAYRATKSCDAWFDCTAMQCSISLSYQTPPRLPKLKHSRDRVENVLERASNAYKVAHNPLTLLLARDEFRLRLDAAIESLGDLSRSESEVQPIEQPTLLALLALDIDHFKQVNDSHGHLYGDQVLKTFAVRLEEVAGAITKENPSVTVSMGHPSGEEFLVLLKGTATQEKIIAFANAFRRNIADKPLPSEADWNWLSARENLTVLVPPPLHERNITTSVGVAIYSHASSGEIPQDRISKLLDQADTALYRAKAGGRNQVILFDDILNSCGRVIEQDTHTRIIAIDVGKNVGVAVGQEFKVFPPGFTGKRKFSISDGRTTRTIGVYPKFDLTRITTFDVQPELSFAFISNPTEAEMKIELGSHLEAIPIGSIGHLVPHAAKFLARAMDGVQIGDISAAQDFIKTSSQSGTKPFALVFRFARADVYLKQYGPAPLNAALARLFRAATSRFHTAAATAVLDAGSICTVGRGAAYDENRLITFVNELADELPELGLVAGVFCNADIESAPKKPQSKLSSEHAIEFARYAASDYAIPPTSRYAHFNHSTALHILQALRESRALSQGQTDFEKLQLLGVESSLIINQGALIYTALGNRRKASELIEKAISMEPDVPIYRSNFGTVTYALGEIDRPLRVLAELDDKAVNLLKETHPFGFVTYARLLAKARIGELPSFDERRFSLIANDALNLPDFKGSSESEFISKALAMNKEVS